jgi:hypothetical protein
MKRRDEVYDAFKTKEAGLSTRLRAFEVTNSQGGYHRENYDSGAAGGFLYLFADFHIWKRRCQVFVSEL